ncbi:hypothetical protein B0H12DRAFT_1076529 [Mycena haematopus]|nr:hypothetical protein B0H12DRAFT_1076529 [Mycena haematopus]
MCLYMIMNINYVKGHILAFWLIEDQGEQLNNWIAASHFCALFGTYCSPCTLGKHSPNPPDIWMAQNEEMMHTVLVMSNAECSNISLDNSWGTLNTGPVKLNHPKRTNIELATGFSMKFPYWDEGVGVPKRNVMTNVPDV